MCTLTHMHACTRMYTLTHIRTRVHTHTHMHACAHMYTLTHMSTYHSPHVPIPQKAELSIVSLGFKQKFALNTFILIFKSS